MKNIIIQPEIFTNFPDFKRGIIIVKNIKNESSNTYIQDLLDEQINTRREFDLNDHRITHWDNVHQKFNSNANRFPPSIKQLLKRVANNGNLPFINSVVAGFNYISLKYIVPCGGDDVTKITGNPTLGFATGNENFIPLGSTENEPPIKGEVIYFDDKTLNVMCRRWNWRNGDFTKITTETNQIIINIDGIGSISKETVITARDELAKLLQDNCSADLDVEYLDKDHHQLVLN